MYISIGQKVSSVAGSMMKISLKIPLCILLFVTLSEPKSLQRGRKHLNNLSPSQTHLKRGERGLTSSEWHMQPRSNKIEGKQLYSWRLMAKYDGNLKTFKGPIV